VRTVAKPIAVETVRAAVPSARFVLLGALHEDDVDPAAFEVLEAAAAPVAADIQGYTRCIEGQRVRPRSSRHLARVLALSQIVKASEDELAVAQQALGASADEIAVSFDLQHLLITAGSRGGRVVRPGQATLAYPGIPTQCLDSTGAGDVFFAAYLCQCWLSGASVQTATEHAALVAAEHVKGAFLPQAWRSLA
jgi:sugar/nucleoside kinase (ribokinase family)